MVILGQILNKLDITRIIGSDNIAIDSICFDSRMVSDNSLFVAVKGTRVDGHNYIDQAISSGAKVVVCEQLPEILNDSICWVLTRNSAKALSLIAANFFDNPSQKLRLVGVTGTNGKTTIASLLYELYISLGYRAGLISTTGNRIFRKKSDATHTTPDPVQLNSLLSDMLDEGCEFVFMEVSSIALGQHRTDGLVFEGGIFTNLTHDHLDYHLNFDNYIAAKKRFFDGLAPSAFALVNIDDRRAEVMIQNCSAKKTAYSMQRDAKYRCSLLEERFEGMLLKIDSNEVSTRFIGSFNAYNLLAVYGAAMEMGADKTEVLVAISKMNPVEGRLELIRSSKGPLAIVDYAHTPDALENVLEALNRIKDKSISLITVVGAGGDRDRSKRPLLGKIAASESTRVVFTSDNPRSEDPEKIIDEIISGVPHASMKRVLRVSDRREAIKTALMLAAEQDIVLVAGKGHETYQEVKGVKNHFDDREVLEEALTK